MPLRVDLLQPIAGGNPSGVSLREQPVYEEIKDARFESDSGKRRPEDPPARKADWPKVLKLTTDSLATRSKDLEIAGWMVEALIRRDGIAGLRDGLQLVKGMIDGFWDTLYPPIVVEDDEPFANRVARLSWMGHWLVPALQSAPLNKKGHGLLKFKESRDVRREAELAGDEKKLEERNAKIKDGKLSPEEFDRAVDETPTAWYVQLVADTQASLTLLSTLNARCAELMPGLLPDATPDFGPLRSELEAFDRVARELLARKPDAPALPPVRERSDNENGTGEAQPNDGRLPVEPRSLDDVTERLIAVARYLRQQSPGDPGPYLMLRGLRWGELRRAADAFDERLLAAPSTAVRAQIKSLAIGEKWSDVLEACEELMARPEGRGWLDLQRFAVRACDNLGGDFEAVGRAIRGELSLLLHDLPTLADRTLMDETPTANRETREWLLEQHLLGTNGAEPAELSATSSPAVAREPRGGDASFDRAREAARSGQPKRALEILTHERARERSARARFLRQIQMATIMVESGLESLAKPLLDELLSTINEHQLDNWEMGELVAQPLALLHRVLAKLEVEEDLRRQIYLRICKLDPLQALNLGA